MKKKLANFLINENKENYNKIAKNFSSTRKKFWQELSFLFDYINDRNRLLDVGCGNGRLFGAIKEKKKIEYIGVDNAEKLLEIARSKYPGLKFIVSEATNLPFLDNYFDAIFAIALFHHLPPGQSQKKFLFEAKRVLRPGGILVLSVWKVPFFKKQKIRIRSFPFFLKKGVINLNSLIVPWSVDGWRYIYSFSKKRLKKEVKKSGFLVEKMKIIKRNKNGDSNILLVAKKMSP